MEAKKVYVVGAKRTAVGNFLGTLSGVHPKVLGSTVVKELLASSGVKPENVDEVICGNVLGGGLGQNIGRTIALEAGIPDSVCAHTTNMLCGSGMRTVMEATMSIQVGFNDIVVAGGVESMSQAPYLIPANTRSGNKMGSWKAEDHMLHDALIDTLYNIHMGVTAENIAEKYKIGRQEQDEFAMGSQKKAIAAQDAGKFKEEIVPVVIPSKKGDIVFDTDEFPNRKTDVEKLGKLKPAFIKDGTVTAGNASGINDGASFMVLASEDAVKKYGLKPLCEVVAYGQGGVDPRVMGLGPTPAIRKALNSAGMKLADMEIIELNEAFAAQSLGVIHELVEEHGVDKAELMAKTNVNGSAIALGHPVGISGNRIMVSMIHEMKRTGKKLGLASLCIGGGQGTAVILKLV
ncbi:MAG: acetyl-CoA C-acetyltransferase [Spirochaetaceae bacterium]|nr:acetyl-CoA C-acetyltransferase [Spirochaetaceae bacterium]MBQ7367258.1 acetyl-CoA C-acetyltransferase [Spirochaetaceae bacterium]MBQ8560838.1 acetyl-CoA C-acetyltransferase [Spirochaetaceae bacterium]MBR2362106.1 acetyl-CoA C-acetyltransferase [Spirochaetaceae bacterium]MBR2461975.1 acetyl-CoA C-acetyltransferase [Spirochaetaceae bacterium]